MLQALAGVVLLQLLYWICREAYEIRLYAVEEFGRVIHEFDPYFNYRATEVSRKQASVAVFVFGFHAIFVCRRMTFRCAHACE